MISKKTVDDNYGIDRDGPTVVEENIDTVIVPRIELTLTDHGTEQLQQVNVLDNSDDSGIDIF